MKNKLTSLAILPALVLPAVCQAVEEAPKKGQFDILGLLVVAALLGVIIAGFIFAIRFSSKKERESKNS